MNTKNNNKTRDTPVKNERDRCVNTKNNNKTRDTPDTHKLKKQQYCEIN